MSRVHVLLVTLLIIGTPSIDGQGVRRTDPSAGGRPSDQPNTRCLFLGPLACRCTPDAPEVLVFAPPSWRGLLDPPNTCRRAVGTLLAVMQAVAQGTSPVGAAVCLATYLTKDGALEQMNLGPMDACPGLILTLADHALWASTFAFAASPDSHALGFSSNSPRDEEER